jgi:hypothetical protein
MLQAVQSGVQILVEVRDSSLIQKSRLALGTTHPSMQWVLGPGCYVKHSPPSGAEVKNENFTLLHYNLSALKFVNLRNIDNGELMVTVIGFSRIAKFHALPGIS